MPFRVNHRVFKAIWAPCAPEQGALKSINIIIDFNKGVIILCEQCRVSKALNSR